MRLVCPNCDAEYEVDDSAIPAEGRDVQCSNCTTTWFQPSASALAEDSAAPETPSDSDPEAEADAPFNAAPEPEPERDAAPQTALDDAAQTAAVAATAMSATPRKPAIDQAALDVIHEEVARETAAREAERGGIETQPDLGLDDTDTEERAAAARSRMVRRRGLEPQADTVEDSGADNGALAAAPKREDSTKKELFPDIEEINSTLSPEAAEAEAEAARAAAAGELPQVAANSSFRTGFGLMLLLMVGLLVLYVYAPQITARVPALEGPLDSYVRTVDSARVALDGMVQGLVERIGTKLEDQSTAGQ